ncbi:MAG: transglutaminase-like domain-containing protein, partial [Oscillospiraceae bacterium]|nr:transglutaminase-like domain-containing protein [Oscillospiraceae bacterium]
ATGTVKINVVAKTDKKVKIAVEKGDKKYNYDLNGDGKVESYPLQWGNGEYTVKVLIQASDPNKYSVALTQKIKLELKDEKAPYMNPSQLVNYNKDSEIVKKAAELAKNTKTELEKVEAIYKFVIQSLAYDTKKATTVQSGYIPDVDKIVDSGLGICFDYAAVLAAMLRSQGIPAKLVMGYVKAPNSKDPVYHAWNEFYLAEKGGWFKINEMKFDGKKFERVDPTFDSSNKSNKASIKFIGDGSNYSKSWDF